MLCEIPIPDGWEFVGYRKSRVGEFTLEEDGYYAWNINSAMKRIVIRKQWQPPDFLPDGWIAKYSSGEWYWFSQRPTLSEFQWVTVDEFCRIDMLIWDRPPVTDWKESLREIKRGAK